MVAGLTINLHNRRVLLSVALVSYLLATTVAVLHHHHHGDQYGHTCVWGSVCEHDRETQHCHRDEADPHDHRSEDDHHPVPEKHDDCSICQFLFKRPLSAPTVTVVQLVQQVTSVEPLSLEQPPDVFISRYDCRGPPSVG